MKSFLIAVIFLIIGGAIGGFVALGFGSVAGLAGGSQVGICLAMETAKSNGLLTAEQVDTVIADTVNTIRSKSSADATKEIKWISSEKGCAELVADITKSLQ
ncbi:MAG: hypothetical protein IZT60_09800 [Gammaproteobacteria bacterium]|nr:hypothetical protein [Gammaproteobacteria bacterium]